MVKQLRSLPFTFPGIPGIKCLFSTIYAGDMGLKCTPDLREKNVGNRLAFKESAGFTNWAEVDQVHGGRMLAARGDSGVDPQPLEEADGLYTLTPDTGLVIKTADCQPILFTREDGLAIAALHVGWRGNANNFPGSAVAELCDLFSCRPNALRAVRGPSLGPAASEFVNFDSEWPGEFSSWYDLRNRSVNLWQLTKHQLVTAGLDPEHIYSLDMCTHDMPDLFYSHRRKDAGRHVNAIWFA